MDVLAEWGVGGSTSQCSGGTSTTSCWCFDKVVSSKGVSLSQLLSCYVFFKAFGLWIVITYYFKADWTFSVGKFFCDIMMRPALL